MCDISRGIAIGIVLESTLFAFEMLLIFPIGLLAVTAHTTSARGVAWVNHSYLDARDAAFVLHEGAQLSKGPVAQKPTHLSMEAGAGGSNPGEVFERQCLARGFGRAHQFFADAMISLRTKRSWRFAAFFKRLLALLVPHF